MEKRKDYHKMLPNPKERLQKPFELLEWNLIGRTSMEDIDKFVLLYKRRAFQQINGVVRLKDLCSDMHKTRALFLDVVMSILWSRFAFKKKYRHMPLVTNIVYTIDGMGHMKFEVKPEKMETHYHFQIQK